MITITIPNWRPSPLNTLLGHWAKAHKHKKTDRNIVATYTNHLPKAETKRRVHLTIILGPSQRATDPDSPLKSLGDALVHAKMLKDDSYKWVEWAPVKFVKGDMATIIQLEDI